MKHFARSICFAAAALVAVGAQAATVSGSADGFTWEARSNIVGQTSTGTVVSGGNPIYQGAMPKYSGVTQLVMTYANGASFVCSGALLADRASVLTAAHCLNPSATTGALKSVTAHFYNGTDRDAVINSVAGRTSYLASGTTMHPLYTGEVIDQNDIAIVTLNGYVARQYSTYDLYSGSDLTGVDFNVAGYGARSSAGGNVGADLGTGRLRQGDNRYDFRMGDADFRGFFTQESFYGAQAQNVWLSDFDNGLSANDASCRLSGASNFQTFGLSAAKYCNTGRGATEVSTAGGDSGGPQFVNGQISSVTSFGLSFGANFGDIRSGLQSSFGELNGFVPVSIHRDFIESLRVPEPGSLALVGLAGFMMLAARRRKTQA